MPNPYGKPQGGFLEDYSGISAAGSAMQGFFKGMQDIEDRNLKHQEMDAKMKSYQSEMQRHATESALKMREQGLQQDPGTGQIVDAPPTQKQKTDRRLKEIAEGVKQDPNTGDYVSDPTTPKMKGIEASKVKFDSNEEYRKHTIGDRNDTKDRREHERVLTRVNSNPNVKARLTQYQNLDNALKTITDADSLTPQQIMEFQQAVRSNLGIKGTSGVGEREETYFKTAGLNAANWKQFLTGEPAAIAKDSKLLNHFKNLANIEQQNISKQFDKSLGAASAGHASMYSRRADLKADLMDALSAQKEQVGGQGLVSPGMISPGLVRGPQVGIGTPSANSHPEASAAEQWARSNPQDPRAQEILKRLGR